MRPNYIKEKIIIAETPIHKEFRKMMDKLGIKIYSRDNNF